MREPVPIDRELLAPALADFREAYTLPGVAYTSPDVFAWEKQRFFEDTWVCLGRTDELTAPNSRRVM